MKPPTIDELNALERSLAGYQDLPFDATRIREIIFLYKDLRRSFADLAECQLATEEGFSCRKSTPKHEIRRAESIRTKYIVPALGDHRMACDVDRRNGRLKELELKLPPSP